MTKRLPITPQMKIDCLLSRADIRCIICAEVLLPGVEIEWDHIQALVHQGSHDYWNLRPLHPECHKSKTARDIAANAKVKRIIADKPSKRPMQNSHRKIPSRPFQTRRIEK